MAKKKPTKLSKLKAALGKARGSKKAKLAALALAGAALLASIHSVSASGGEIRGCNKALGLFIPPNAPFIAQCVHKKSRLAIKVTSPFMDGEKYLDVETGLEIQ